MNEQKDTSEKDSRTQQPAETSKKRVHTPEPPQIKDPSRHPSRQEEQAGEKKERSGNH
ncbi:hypothetical protein [Cesiribacter andamanensis]|uniref:Uncharacterized protein n=1 Tax=Cesiribacter andamanensis AMV16 TaxID=1279009 RepID=M7NM57_9BACT|nr:hypothetical protein [Cesiribacter andamanensis]EMR02860.1 hypothetical protein ADICEAN_02007 [Cesiribacter andamanensis AMV16]